MDISWLLAPQHPFLLLPVTELVLALETCLLSTLGPCGLVSCLNTAPTPRPAPSLALSLGMCLRMANEETESPCPQQLVSEGVFNSSSGTEFWVLFCFVLTLGRLRDGLPAIQIICLAHLKMKKKMEESITQEEREVGVHVILFELLDLAWPTPLKFYVRQGRRFPFFPLYLFGLGFLSLTTKNSE